MTLEEFGAILEETGIAAKYYQFENDEEIPERPWLIYYRDTKAPFYADNTVYFSSEVLIVELYCEELDTETEHKVEGIFKSHGLNYQTDYEYIPDEHLYLTIYTIYI